LEDGRIYLDRSGASEDSTRIISSKQKVTQLSQGAFEDLFGQHLNQSTEQSVVHFSWQVVTKALEGNLKNNKPAVACPGNSAEMLWPTNRILARFLTTYYNYVYS